MRKNFKVILDCDDVLFGCNEQALLTRCLILPVGVHIIQVLMNA